MTCGDERFRHAVGPYLLGSLAEVDRAEFDQHLADCPDCRAELAGLRPVVAALSTVHEAEVAGLGADQHDIGLGGAPPDAPPVGPVPDTLLSGLLAHAARRARRRRVLLGSLGGIAAAAVVALIVVLVAGGPGGSPTEAVAPAHVMQMNPVDGSPVHATAMVTGMPWGTKITLHCHYQGTQAGTGGESAGPGWPDTSAGPAPPTAEGGPVYSLRVTDRRGSVHDVGSWAVTGRQDTVFTGGTSVPMGQIGRIDVVAADGSTVLTANG